MSASFPASHAREGGAFHCPLVYGSRVEFFRPRADQFFFGSAFGGGAPALAAFSRSSCSRRNCSSRLNRFAGGAIGFGIGGGAAAAAGAGASFFGGKGTSIRSSL